MSKGDLQKSFPCTGLSRARLCRYLSWAGFCLVVTALMAFSLVRAVMATHECLWPIGWDLLRDVGMGQTMLDGRYPEDPILLNETLWYNPLTGALLALGSRLSGLSMPRVGVLAGPFLNLLAPLGFTVLATCLFGRAAALAGLCLVLFGRDPVVPVWVTFSYFPWVTASLYAAGLLLLFFAVYHASLERRSWVWHVAAGVLLGVTFMAHTAPAIVAGGAMLLFVAWEGVRLMGPFLLRRQETGPVPHPDLREARWLAAVFAALLAVAFLISLPYTWSILYNYQFQVRNPAPSLFALDYVLLEQLPDRVREALNWRNLFATLGFLTLLYRRNRADRLVLCWTLTVCLLLAQHYLWQWLETGHGLRVPGIVPGHHGSIHLTAVRAVLFGVGVAAAGKGGVLAGCRALRRFWSGRSQSFFSVLTQAACAAAACAAGFALYAAHPLTAHPDFQQPDMTLYHQYHQRGIPMYEWILKHTDPHAVFICHEDELAMTIVMPAARKLLFPPYIYSNPFVDPGPLSYHQRLLVESVSNKDAVAFCTERNKYANVYMILREADLSSVSSSPTILFSEVFRAEGLVLFEARPCEARLR